MYVTRESRGVTKSERVGGERTRDLDLAQGSQAAGPWMLVRKIIFLA